MNIDLLKINKEVLIECLSEENDRDDFTRNTLERQIKDHQTYGKQEEFEQVLIKYKHKKDYFNSLINIIQSVEYIEERDKEHISFWKDLIEHQIYISKRRIEDWSVGGIMYESCKRRNWQDFDAACDKLNNIELEKIKCMEEISLMINK